MSKKCVELGGNMKATEFIENEAQRRYEELVKEAKAKKVSVRELAKERGVI